MKDLIRLANAWREKWDCVGKGGVVVIFKDEVQGWVNELRDPQSWVPSCVAIDEHGSVWVACEGDEYSGAEKWVQVSSIEYDDIKGTLMCFSEFYKGFTFIGYTTGGLQIRAHRYLDDGRERVNTHRIRLEDISPDWVEVAGFPVELLG